MIFEDFFACATGSHPYPYQATLAKAAHMPTLLKIPTGAGKTESAVLGWLYRTLPAPGSGRARLHSAQTGVLPTNANTH